MKQTQTKQAKQYLYNTGLQNKIWFVQLLSQDV